MRIALATEYYYPHLGGVTEHVHHLAVQLNAWGHETIVITGNMSGQGRDPDFVRRIGQSRVIYSNGSFARLTTGWGLTRQVTDLLRREHIDLVHVQDVLAPTQGLVASSAAWRLGLPVVATSHTWFTHSTLYWLFRGLLQPRLDRVAARIAVSEPVVHAVSKYFRAEWEVIPNGVDVTAFHPNGRAPQHPSIQAPRLLFLGRLDPRNGLDTMLAAMPAILARHPDAQLVVAGDGPLRSHYRRRAAPFGDRVQFLGAVFDERAEVYGSADIYVCPTTKASFGITLLEAMACGTPLLVSDITGFRELVAGGAEAVLVPKDEPAAWSRAVIDLLADPEGRTRMRAAGLAKAATYAWPRIARRVLDVYERVMR